MTQRQEGCLENGANILAPGWGVTNLQFVKKKNNAKLLSAIKQSAIQ